jgi:hypothetical protein
MRKVQVIIERCAGPTGPFFKPIMLLIHRFMFRGSADPGRHIVPQSRLVSFGDKDIMAAGKVFMIKLKGNFHILTLSPATYREETNGY